ncbi:MAG: hypothetical protein P8080_04980 [Gammaproteobacteria bacterium]
MRKQEEDPDTGRPAESTLDAWAWVARARAAAAKAKAPPEHGDETEPDSAAAEPSVSD